MDEKGVVGPVSSGFSESTVSVAVPRGDESLKENLGSDWKVEGSCNEGEGEEIMVEVVGSDVFVDGFGGVEELEKEGSAREVESFQSECDLRSRQAGHLDSPKWVDRNENEGKGFQEMAMSSGQGVEHVSEMEKVEVLSSDVFVDGFGGVEELGKEGSGREVESLQSEGDLRLRQAGDLGGPEWVDRNENEGQGFQEMAVSSGGGVEHVSEMEKVEVVTRLPREQSSVVSVEKVEVRVSQEMIVEERDGTGNMHRDGESHDGGGIDHGCLAAERIGVSDDGLENAGIESANIYSSLMPEPTSEHTQCAGEEAAVPMRQDDFSGRDDALHDGVANANLTISGEDQSSATNKDSISHPYPESSEAVRQDDFCGKESALLDGVANANLPLSGEDRSSVIEAVYEATAKDSVTHAHSESSDSPAEAAAVIPVEGVNNEDILHSKDGTTHENVPHNTGCGGISEDVERAGADSTEHSRIESDRSEAASLKSVNLVSGDLEGLATENAQSFSPIHTSGCIKDQELAVEAESNSKIDEVVYMETEVVDNREIPPVNCQDLSIKREDPSLDVKDRTCLHSEDSHGVKAEIEYGGVGMETDGEELLDCKDKGPGIGAAGGKLIYLPNDADMRIVKPDGKPTQTVDGGTNVAFDAANTLTSSNKDCLEANTGISAEHILVAKGENEVMDDKNISKTSADDLDGDASNRKLNRQDGAAAAVTEQLDEHTDTEISKGHVVETDGTIKVSAIDASDNPNMSLLANEENLIGEIVGVSEAEDVVRGDSFLGAEAGISNTACPGANLDVVEQYVETKNEEVVEQQADVEMMDASRSEDPVDGTDVIPVSGVNVTAGSGCAMSSASFIGKSNSEICLPEVNVHLSNNNLSPQDGEQHLISHTSNVVNSNELLNQGIGVEDESCKTSNEHSLNGNSGEAELMDFQQDVEVDKNCPGGDQIDSSGEVLQVDQHSFENNNSEISSDRTVNTGSCLKLHQSGYLLPPENEGQFSVSDLVWGKVRSHPWWPGQICDPADASEKAVKYFKKDCFLVAYFGDRTFAWNDASVLKPFRSYFSQIDKQSTSEAFQNAVSCALAEVSRRVELGLACSCIPQDVSGKLEYQIVENTGIREESSKQYNKDKSSGVASFQPDKLIDYVRQLALFPSGRFDRLDLVIARAQLLAFCRYKGYRSPPEFLTGGELLENNAELGDHEFNDEQNQSNKSSSQKRKHDLKDGLTPKKKERSLSELMGDNASSPDAEDDLDGRAQGKQISSSAGKKMKAGDSLADGSDKRISIYAAKVSTTTSTVPKPSFKIGECIRRVASQLTGSASFKSNGDQPGNNLPPQISETSERGSIVIPTEFSSLNEMLLQLQLAAQNPRGCSISNDIVTFFSCFRNSVASGARPNSSGGRAGSGRKRKTSQSVGGAAEEFEFDDANDSYWTDRIVQNYSEEQLLQNGENAGGEYQLAASDPGRPLKSSRRSHSRKRYSHEMADEEPFEYVDRKMQKLSPAELILNFAEGSPPSDTNLNKIFRRFGPLKESDTEVDHESRRAKVVFKRGSDAEVAYSSAGMVNIFGSILVTYQLNYSPLSSFKALPPATLAGAEEAT